jgi:hypothetical protein
MFLPHQGQLAVLSLQLAFKINLAAFCLILSLLRLAGSPTACALASAMAQGEGFRTVPGVPPCATLFRVHRVVRVKFGVCFGAKFCVSDRSGYRLVTKAMCSMSG